MSDLFPSSLPSSIPLAAQLRPQTLDDCVGQLHLLGEGKPLRRAVISGQLHSMIFWGPPGSGKTTLAHILANSCDAKFISLSAVLCGVKDIREAVEQARMHSEQGHSTIVFVDEVHRFNKSQQDALLPHVESGIFTFIGATTENPSFEINNALLSRARVYVLERLDTSDLMLMLKRAINKLELNEPRFRDELLSIIAEQADGDARRAYGLLERCLDLFAQDSHAAIETVADLAAISGLNARQFDNKGDGHYEQISALHKAVRGSDVDASLYWFCRMLDGGIDPLYIARRVVRMASEDIGNADPDALGICLSAWDTQQRLGAPEGQLAIAQAITYLATAPKSNAVYAAFNEARAMVADGQSEPVPMHLRNASTALQKDLNYGANYQYAHNFPYHYAPNVSYWPDNVSKQSFYRPTGLGFEKKINDRIAFFARLDKESQL